MKKKKNKNKPTYPKPLNKKTVVDFAVKHHSERPMIFWENVRIWNWYDLLLGPDGKPDKELLLQRLSELHIFFSDDGVVDNRRSIAVIAKVTIPTRREWLRLSDKYGYELEATAPSEAGD